MNGKTHMNVTNTCQCELCIYKGQSIGLVDLRSAGYFFILLEIIYKDVYVRDSFSSMKKNHKITCHSCTQVMKNTTEE